LRTEIAMPLPALVKRHAVATTIVFLIATPVVIFTLWVETTLHYSYSKGERAGFLQKVSKRGWLCKTWEGELQLTAMPGATPEKFTFSTRSDSIAALLNHLSGEQVVLDYEQHKGVPGSCFGDTEYFVTGARPVGTP
jgi:hypothetical protein